MHHKLIFVLTYFLPYVFWIRVIWVILIGLGITNDLSAQESTRLHLAVGPQLSHHILQDEGMSLSRYAGTQSGAFLALEKRKKQRLSLITWNAGSGNIKAVGRQGARVNRAEQNFFEANYLFLTELKATQERPEVFNLA